MSETLPFPELYTTILRVRHLERSLEWYERVLGLQPQQLDRQYRLAILVGPKGQTLTLRELSQHDVQPSSLESAYVVFMTPDSDGMRAQLLAQGEKVSPVQDHPGVRLFWLYDPDEHPLCILQFVIDWAG